MPGPIPDFVELQVGGGGVALAGALPRAPNGIRASSDVPLLTSEEGAKMDLLEQANPGRRYYSCVDAMVSVVFFA